MKERPILFSGPMVRAILDGRKTQTRRAIRDQDPFDDFLTLAPAGLVCPYGAPGDHLWAKETFAETPHGVFYRADDPIPREDDGPWTPSIFMPRWASRILLELTEVRVQRVQDISEADAEAEGIDTCCVDPSPRGIPGLKAKNYVYAREYFQDLWNRINAKRGFGWDVNPWVWALTFRRIDSNPIGGREPGHYQESAR